MDRVKALQAVCVDRKTINDTKSEGKVRVNISLMHRNGLMK